MFFIVVIGFVSWITKIYVCLAFGSEINFGLNDWSLVELNTSLWVGVIISWPTIWDSFCAAKQKYSVKSRFFILIIVIIVIIMIIRIFGFIFKPRRTHWLTHSPTKCLCPFKSSKYRTPATNRSAKAHSHPLHTKSWFGVFSQFTSYLIFHKCRQHFKILKCNIKK